MHAIGKLPGAADGAAPGGPNAYSVCAIPRICSRDIVPTMSGCLSWMCCSTLVTSSSSDSPRTVSPHGQSTFIAIAPPLGRKEATLRRCGEPVERLPGGGLLGGLLRAPGTDAGLLTVDHGCAGERAVMGWAFDVEHRVGDLPAAACQLLLKLRLVVDVARQRVRDP